MRTLFAMPLFTLLVAGCAHLPSDDRVVSLTFRGDPLSHSAEEAIEQIEIVAPSARVHRVGKLPKDWHAGISRNEEGAVECTLTCLHQSFAEPDIHEFDGAISLLVPEGDAPAMAKVRVWITRGPLGPGRIIDLSKDDFSLR